MDKSVTIQIAPADLKLLRNNGYVLCFARCVENSYNVIWQSFVNYLAYNSFGWSDRYRLFGTSSFTVDESVGSRTNAVDIAVGQQAILDAAGVLSAAAGGGPSDRITMINNYGLIHPALTCLSTGPDVVPRTTPIYVAPKPVVPGTAPLHPADKIQVWFQQNAAPSMMMLEAVSNAVVIDLTETNSATRLYQDGNWATPAVE